MAPRVARLRLICCFNAEFLLTSPLALHYETRRSRSRRSAAQLR